MDQKTRQHLDLLIGRYEKLGTVRQDIEAAFRILETCYENGGKLLLCGNGGSAADCIHISGELMKGFCKKRPLDEKDITSLRNACPELSGKLAEKLQNALPAVSLTEHTGLNTAFANDADPELCFAQQVWGFGCPGDVLMAISTSGMSGNVLYAAAAARAKGMKVIALSGRDGGKLKELADVSVTVPENETFMIQELHLPVYHCLCRMLEDRFFDE